MNPQPVAFSYVRFSNPAQATGDSLRRQTEAARSWCQRNFYLLDQSTTLRDLGASAYLGTHRSNPDRYALAGFLKLVEDGKVPRGSALVVESLDRLSREHIRPALSLVLNLIEAGIRLVQLKPVEAVYDEKVEPMSLMMAIMELSRGHSESKVKSDRVGEAWTKKKNLARAAAHLYTPGKDKRKENAARDLYTSQVPGWLRVTAAGLELIPERAKVVRDIFDKASHGYGHTAIVVKLLADGVPAWGKNKNGEWKRSYVASILCDRRAVGEFQPRTRGRKPDGDPIPGYYPAAVTEAEYHAARAGADARRNTLLKSKGGKTGPRATSRSEPKKITRHATMNLFVGLIVSARDPGDRYYATQRVVSRPDRTQKRSWVLINAQSIEGQAKCVSFPLGAFETAVLQKLKEIDPRELLSTATGPDEVLALAGELSGVEAKVAELEVELLTGDVPSLARVLRSLEERRRELSGRLAEARSRQATPTAAAWGETKSLLDVLSNSTDREDARQRLRAALRRIIERVTLLVVTRGRTKLAAVRVDFAGGRHRDFLIVHKPVHPGFHGVTPERLAVASAVWAEGAGGLDLRMKEDAAAVEELLTTLDIEAHLRPVDPDSMAMDTPPASRRKKAIGRKP